MEVEERFALKHTYSYFEWFDHKWIPCSLFRYKVIAWQNLPGTKLMIDDGKGCRFVIKRKKTNMQKRIENDAAIWREADREHRERMIGTKAK